SANGTSAARSASHAASGVPPTRIAAPTAHHRTADGSRGNMESPCAFFAYDSRVHRDGLLISSRACTSSRWASLVVISRMPLLRLYPPRHEMKREPAFVIVAIGIASIAARFAVPVAILINRPAF